MSILPPGRDQGAEEKSYLAVSHRTKNRRPRAAEIMQGEHFFDASRREERDVWAEFYKRSWESPKGLISGADLTSALRDYLAGLQHNQCCYCRQPLLKGGFARPIEHVLSRVEHPRFTLHFWNLAVSCERCNRLKINAESEVLSHDIRDYPKFSDFKSQFHPRFHEYGAHVKHTAMASPGFYVPLYVGRTNQGRKLCSQFLHKAALEMTLIPPDSKLYGDLDAIRKFVESSDEALVDKIIAVHTVLMESAVQSGST